MAVDQDLFPLSHVKKVIKSASLEEWQKRYTEGSTSEITKCFFSRMEQAYRVLRQIKMTFQMAQILTDHGSMNANLNTTASLNTADRFCELNDSVGIEVTTKLRQGGNSESRAFGSMAARVALDEPERSDSDTDLSDDLYGIRRSRAGGLGNAEAAGRWSRAAGRPRPSTRTLTAAGARRRSEDDFADLVQGVDGSPGDDSLGSSDETELQAAAPAPAPASRRSAGVRAPTALSDNEF
ncbi:hypothetical protein EVAR_82526_1 [Eumeta japonica]|uniref:Uncharacterized protein n=1 Tax=Eumeta variegata TaxID=151549 RepID=A0A4C1UYD0_EUMVA|nr:hypothetical protein EVAR_82526_1 [Eumeta japonica]